VTGRWLGLVAGLALAIAACVPAVPAQPTPTPAPLKALKLRVGSSTTPLPALPNSVLWVAKDLGFYDREGLDVDLVAVQADPAVVASLRTGDLDLASISADQVVRLKASGSADLKGIGSVGASSFFMIVSRDRVASAADLKGRRFAIAQVGSVDDVLTRRVLAARGVDTAEVQFFPIGVPNVRAQALLADQVDATTMTVATWVTIKNEPALKVLISLDEVRQAVPQQLAGVSTVTAQTIQQKPEELRRFTLAILKASRYLLENKQAWVDAMVVHRPDLDRQDLEFLWDQFGTSWAVNGWLSSPEYQRFVDYLYETTPDFKDVPRIGMSDWVETRFVDQVLKEIGVYPKLDDPGRPIR
jgi:NitT/TauT family transport system substrate-binding protein